MINQNLFKWQAVNMVNDACVYIKKKECNAIKVITQLLIMHLSKTGKQKKKLDIFSFLTSLCLKSTHLFNILI